MQSPVTIPCSQAVIHSSLVRAPHQNMEDCGLDSYCGLPFFSSKHFFMYLITIFSFVTLEIVMRKTIIKFNEKGVCLTKLFTDVCLVVHLIFPVKNCLNTALKTYIPTQVMQRTSQHRTPKGLYNRNYLVKPTLWTMNFRLTYLDSLRNLINILRFNDGLNTNRKNQLIHIITILYKSNKYNWLAD